MPLHRLKDYYPNYRETLANGQMENIDSYSIYTEGGDRVGTAKDLLVDESGRFRYLVVDTGPWIFGKTVLMPIGLAQFDYDKSRIYVNGLSKSQVENLPEYKEDTVVDDKYEEQVRSGYRPVAQGRSSRQFLGNNYAAPNDASVMNPLDTDRGMQPLESSTRGIEETRRVTARQEIAQPTAGLYDQEPSLYGYSEEDNHGPLRLYEERLIAHHQRNKVGEVSVGKRVLTETAEVAETVDKERVVIERHAVTGQAAVPGDHAFDNQEVARMEVYEEEISVEKQPFVREEVNVRKETDHETVRAREQVRREELDIKTEGNPRINQNPSTNQNPRINP
ncbi:DUF2382 domain-containing protein [Pseudanabaena sp. FACHB-2040]|uniref:DUF2382 domain-containing protein n=1 Tax=Pseudanabaena sp. FACHB-2040 TaxID=2692859 RepID=UPI0016899F86|nr:DUF2382 domain-containing protein [Pseudanabaena sp. FACHB-2040]MBD2258646.1 DUF2382 domain-containing protein [Pseudanabaena sp. FACHB-2040]